MDRRNRDFLKEQAALEEMQSQIRRERLELNEAREEGERRRREDHVQDERSSGDRLELDARLAETTAKLHSAEERATRLNADLEQIQAELAAATAALKKVQRSEMDLRAEMEAALAHEASVVEHEKNELARARQELVDLHSLLNLSRKCEQEFAAELRNVEESSRTQSIELKLARGRENDLSVELEVLRERCRALEETRESPSPDDEALREECERLRKQLADREAAPPMRPAVSNDETEAEMAALQLELVENYRRIDEMKLQWEDTQSQLAEATAQLAAAQKQLFEAGSEQSSNGSSAEDQDNYHRRYEMALDDLKELKAKNAELQQQVSRAPAGGASLGVAKGVLNWEAEKRRILAALESDSNDEASSEDRLRIEEVIEKTQSILSDKDREINELRTLLEDQSNNLGQVAVGAAALGQALDADAIIQEERESLKRLQEEWREKLRKAEVEISIERAKIARERSQVEEKTHQLEIKQSSDSSEATPSPAAGSSSSKSTKSRWLERLGLGDNDKERGK